MLGVSPNTLRSWERRYGFPKPKRTAGNHRHYELLELQTLRDALAQTGNISSAVELARQRQAEPANGDGLIAAFESFDEGAADRAIEESLAMRPLERTVEELLLPGDRPARRRPRPRGRARVRRPLGDGLAARRPPPRLRRLAAGRNSAARLEPAARTPRRSTRRRST